MNDARCAPPSLEPAITIGSSRPVSTMCRMNCFATVAHARAEARLEILGEGQVEEGVELARAALRAELGDAASDPAGVRARRARPRPRARRGRTPRRGAGRRPTRPEASRATRGRRGAASARAPAVVRTSRQHGHLVEDEGVGELQVQLELVRRELGVHAHALPERTRGRTRARSASPSGAAASASGCSARSACPETRYIARSSSRSFAS